MTSTLFAPITLPNGSTLPNRIAKAAMEEQLSGPGQLPSDDIVRLYQSMAEGGAGLLITGNVMVDARALTSAGGIVLQKDTPLEPFQRWAAAARSAGGQVWMQINHPGRQVWAALGQPGWAPSEIAVDLGKHSKLFAPVQAMTDEEIGQTIQHFVDTAVQAEKAGFTGVEIHAAHGYLISQFLSPLTNRRTDAWGGSLESRARLLLSVVDGVRAAVQPGFCVSVKLTSADFQRGGFDATDAKQVVAMLGQRSVDLVELSGGSYEAPAMQGQTGDGRTLAREAYFLEFAQDIAKGAAMPIMTTGGIRRLAVAEQVLAQGVAVAGIGTALAQCPQLPQYWRKGQDVEGLEPQVKIANKAIASLATMALVRRQLQRVGAGKQPLHHPSAVFSLVRDQWRARKLTQRYLRWMAKPPH